MRVEAKLRDERIPAIKLVDMASADVSDKFLTLSRLYKQDDKESFDFILLNLEEARELKNFLNKNLKETV